MTTLQAELQRLSGTTLDMQGAANVYAGTTGLSLVGALNVAAGTTGLPLKRVLNVIAGTSGLGVVAAASQIPSVAAGYDLILAAGQSNMAGNGSAIDPELDTTHPRIFQFADSGPSAGTIIEASEPLKHHDAPTGMGPALVFARHYIETIPTNRSVLIVPVADGGTGFTSTPDNWDPAAPDDANSLYWNAVHQTEAALAAATGSNVLKVILWVQGENDATNELSQATYATFLDALITGWRTEFGTPTVPFVIGGMVPEGILSTPARQPIAAAQVDTPNRLDYTSYTAGPTGYQEPGEAVHYSAAGQRIVGEVLADSGYPAAVAHTVTVPAAVTSLTADPSTVSIVLSWTAGARASTYLVEWRTSGGTYATFETTYGTSSIVTGLTSATAYDLRVTSMNAAGNSAAVTTTATTDTVVVVDPDPPVTRALFADYDPANLVLADGAAVASLSDALGNEAAEQATAGNRPTFVAADGVFAGQPSLSFDGGDSLRTAAWAAGSQAQPNTIIAVMKVTGNGANQNVYSGISSTTKHSLFSATTNAWNITAGQTRALATGPDGTAQVIGVVYNAASGLAQIDGAAQTVPLSVGSEPLTGLTIGGSATTTPGGLLASGSKIARILVYNDALTSQELTDVMAWAVSRYGV